MENGTFEVIALGETRVERRYTLWSHGSEEGNGGVGIVWSNSMEVVQMKAVSSRIVSVTFSGRPRPVHVVSAYAPHSGRPDEEVEDFWRQLNQHLSTIPHDVALLVGMDANSQARGSGDGRLVGRYALVRNGEPTIGDIWLSELVQRRRLSLANTTMTPRKQDKRRNATHRGPTGSRRQIDFVAVRCRYIGAVQTCRPVWGTVLSSDHAAIVGQLKVRWATRKRADSHLMAKADLSLLRHDSVVQRGYREAVDRFLATTEATPTNAEDTWALMHAAMLAGLRAVPPRVRRADGFRLSDDTVQAGMEVKRIRLLNLTDRAELNSAKRRFRALVRRDGESQMERFADELQAAANKRDQRLLFGLLKQEIGPTRRRKVITEEDEAAIASELRSLYCDDRACVLDERVSPRSPVTVRSPMLIETTPLATAYSPMLIDSTPTQPPPNLTRLPPPTLNSVLEALNGLRPSRAPGLDGVTPPMLLHGGSRLQRLLWELACQFSAGQPLPQTLRIGRVIPLPKEGGYRAITVMPSAFAVLERILLAELKERLPSPAAQQFGAVAGTSVSGAIHVLGDMLQERAEGQLPTWTLLVDFTKAFDRIKRDSVWETLEEASVSTADFRQLYDQVVSRIGRFEVEHARGLLQGGVTSPCLFGFVLEQKVMKKVRDSVSLLVDCEFIDDIAVVTDCPAKTQEALCRIDELSRAIGLQLNPRKTVLLRNSASMDVSVYVGETAIPVAEEAKYLGTVLNGSGATVDASARCNAAWRLYCKLRSRLVLKSVSSRVRAKLYAATVRSVLTYNTEHWGSGLTQLRKLATLDRKFLRTIVGGWSEVDIGGGIKQFRPWANERVYDAARLPRPEQTIARKFHRWVGHLLRMDARELPAATLSRPKHALFKRRRGGQRMTWRRRTLRTYKYSGVIDHYHQWNLGICRLKRLARDRRTWRKLSDDVTLFAV
jgi:hypothetical protein